MSRKKIKKAKKPIKLSPIEKSVMSLIAQGKQVEDIMSELDIDILETVKALQKLYGRLPPSFLNSYKEEK